MEAGLAPTVYAVAISEAPVAPVILVNDTKAAPTERASLNVTPDATVNASTSTTPTSNKESPPPPVLLQPQKSRTAIWILVAIAAVAVATTLLFSWPLNSPKTT
jgi:hypothetical protein